MIFGFAKLEIVVLTDDDGALRAFYPLVKTLAWQTTISAL